MMNGMVKELDDGVASTVIRRLPDTISRMLWRGGWCCCCAPFPWPDVDVEGEDDPDEVPEEDETGEILGNMVVILLYCVCGCSVLLLQIL